MFTEIVSQILALFLVTCIGFLAGKFGFLDDRTVASVNKLLLYVCLPCMTVAAAVGGGERLSNDTVLLALAASCGLCVVLPLLGPALNWLFRVPRNQRAMYRFMALVPNIGFMGYPVVKAFYGSSAVFLNALALMVITTLQFSYGIAVLSHADGGKRSFFFNWRDLVTPGLVASVVALALFFTGATLPGFLSTALDDVGGVAPPLAMMTIGSSLVGVDVRRVLTDWKLHAYALVKQIAVPLAFWFALVPFFPDRLVLGVAVIVLAMPVGAMNVVFASQYRPDCVDVCARAIVVTTLWSFVTLPVLALFIA